MLDEKCRNELLVWLDEIAEKREVHLGAKLENRWGKALEEISGIGRVCNT